MLIMLSLQESHEESSEIVSKHTDLPSIHPSIAPLAAVPAQVAWSSFRAPIRRGLSWIQDFLCQSLLLQFATDFFKKSLLFLLWLPNVLYWCSSLDTGQVNLQRTARKPMSYFLPVSDAAQWSQSKTAVTILTLSKGMHSKLELITVSKSDTYQG